MHEIKIKPALNGFQVQVGCQHLVFNTRHQLLTELDRYLADPLTVENDYRKNGINKYMLEVAAPFPNPPNPATCGNLCGSTGDAAPTSPHVDQVRQAPMPVEALAAQRSQEERHSLGLRS